MKENTVVTTKDGAGLYVVLIDCDEILIVNDAMPTSRGVPVSFLTKSAVVKVGVL